MGVTDYLKPDGTLYAYKTWTPELTAKALDVYRAVQSLFKTSLVIDYASYATIQRIIDEASQMNLQPPVVKRRQGGPAIDRKPIHESLEKHPGAQAKQIAQLNGCSEATVFRVMAGN